MAPRLVSLLPPAWGTYFEPMAGGAALFFFVLPSKAVLADVNGELINFYRVLRDRFSELYRHLRMCITHFGNLIPEETFNAL